MKIFNYVLLFYLLGMSSIVTGQGIERIRDSLLSIVNEDNAFEIYFEIADRCREENMDTSIYYSTKALEIAQKDNSKEELAKVHQQLGSFYYAINNTSEAFHQFSDALKQYQLLNDKNGMVKAHSNLGKTYSAQRLQTKAIQHYIISAELARKNNFREDFYDACINLGNLYYRMERFEKALENYMSAYNFVLNRGEQKKVCGVANNIGSVYLELGDYSKANLFLTKSLTIAKNENFKKDMLRIYNNLGRMYFEQELLERALQYYRKSLRYSMALNSVKNIVNTTRNIGGIFFVREQYDSAHYYLSKTVADAKKNGFNMLALYTMMNLSSMFEEQGDYRKALLYHQKYLAMKDSLDAQKNASELSELQMIYETEVKEFQNKILQQDNEVQKLKIKNQRYIIYLGITLLIIFVFLFLLFYMKFRVIEKQKSELLDKNRRISEQNIISIKSIAKLSESELKYKILINNINSGICLLQDREIIFSNELLSSILTGQTQNLMGNTMDDFIVNEDIPLLYRKMDEVINQKNTQIINIHNITKPEEEIAITLSYIDYLGSSAILCIIDTCLNSSPELPQNVPAKETKTRIAMPAKSNYIKTLIVDDDELNLKYLSKILKKDGFEVSAVNNGQDAIEQFKTDKPDLVLLDIQMPDMNGFEIARELRKIEKEKKLPASIIIAVTAFISENEEKEYKKVGINSLLAKPFLSKDIKHLLKKYIQIG